MTQDMMTLRALLEKSSDADLLREMIGFTAERLMALEKEFGALSLPPTLDSRPATATVPAARSVSRRTRALCTDLPG